MVLADTSVWINHLRYADNRLTTLLNQNSIVVHELVIGELAMGNFRNRQISLMSFMQLPRLHTSTLSEVMQLIELKKLYGLGIGFVDAHLISACLFAGADLLTYDKRLAGAWARCRR